LERPLQRMTIGGVIAASAFFISGFLELEMMKTYAKVPAEGTSHLFMMNSLPCTVDVQLMGKDAVYNFSLPELSELINREMVPGDYTANIQTDASCLPSLLNIRAAETKLTTRSQNVSSLLISLNGASILPTALARVEEPLKDKSSGARVRVIQDLGALSVNNNLTFKGEEEVSVGLQKKEGIIQSDYTKLDFGTYNVSIGDIELGEVYLGQGGVYNLLLAKDATTKVLRLSQYTLTSANTIHILWLIPQYVTSTVAEILVSITGLEFSYSQAPESMKSVLQAAWLLTIAFGNVIVIIVAEAKAFNQAGEFFMFACLMLVDMLLLTFLAYRYVPREKMLEQGNNDIPLQQGGVANNNYKNDE